AARLAIAFLIVALVSALLSRAPDIGLFGLYEWGTGWLFWLSCAGAFAIGASLLRQDGEWVFYGLLGGGLLNVLVAIYQVAVHPATGMLRGYDGGSQADGLLGNPVHLEALLVGAVALVASRSCDSLKRWWWVLVLLGLGVELTSERLAIPVLLVIFAAVLYRRRLKGAVFSGLVAAGYGLGYVVGGSGLGHRVASGTAETTFGLRLQLWHTALHAVALHPLIGGGPGEVLGTIAPLVGRGFARNLTGGRLFTDSHNWIVEVVVTTGLLGLACFAAWLLLAVSRSRGPFLAFAAALLAVELVEPMNIGVTPLAFLAIGAAAAGLGRPARLATSVLPEHAGASSDRRSGGAAAGLRSRRAPAAVTALAVVAALFVGVTMIAGDYFYTQAKTSTFNESNPTRANTLWPYWPESAIEVAF
ncbi:MAG: O-antigen ligase family protein, partial [Acidimicrobiales bacterium]